jgi:hypothetical protein
LVVAITVKFDGTDPSGGNFNLYGAGVEFTWYRLELSWKDYLMYCWRSSRGGRR